MLVVKNYYNVCVKCPRFHINYSILGFTMPSLLPLMPTWYSFYRSFGLLDLYLDYYLYVNIVLSLSLSRCLTFFLSHRFVLQFERHTAKVEHRSAYIGNCRSNKVCMVLRREKKPFRWYLSTHRMYFPSSLLFIFITQWMCNGYYLYLSHNDELGSGKKPHRLTSFSSICVFLSLVHRIHRSHCY